MDTLRFMRRFAALAALAIGGLLPTAGAWAQSQAYPNRPVKMLIGYPPGSATDLFGRAIGQQMQIATGQAVVVDNRPGANTNIATEATVHAAPDGYTVLNTASQIVINPNVMKLSFNTEKDLIPVTQTLAVTYVLLINPEKFPFPNARTLADVVDYVKKNPAKLNYGTYGAGSGSHLSMVMLQRASGMDARHIPYRGSPQMLTALMAGEVDMAFDTTTSSAVHVQAGKLRAIALGGPQQLDVMPGVPTIASTYPGFDTDGWQGIFLPAHTPKPIVDALAAEVRKTLETPELKAQGVRSGVRLVGSTPQQFSAYMKEQLVKYEKIIRENNIKLE
ncbi:MAG: tripartite tricarboxylate transporter substrate binding protein [Pseudomonadota bacterium]